MEDRVAASYHVLQCLCMWQIQVASQQDWIDVVQGRPHAAHIKMERAEFVVSLKKRTQGVHDLVDGLFEFSMRQPDLDYGAS